MQTEEAVRSQRAVNDLLQAIMLALAIALMVGGTAMALVSLVAFLDGLA